MLRVKMQNDLFSWYPRTVPERTHLGRKTTIIVFYRKSQYWFISRASIFNEVVSLLEKIIINSICAYIINCICAYSLWISNWSASRSFNRGNQIIFSAAVDVQIFTSSSCGNVTALSCVLTALFEDILRFRHFEDFTTRISLQCNRVS